MNAAYQRAKALVAQMTLAEKCAQMRYDAPAIERLGVPAYNWWNEALHGVARSGAATVFPQAIGMAASFNAPLMKRVATAISDEARAKYNQYKTFGGTQIYQGLTFWSPNINIFRDPRWGRGHETYGEDPYLTGRMGVAFVQGLQGDDPTYRKLDATLKHFAVHSGPESLRHSFDARPNERDLRETYLWAFKYCIDHAKPAAVMGAYNRVNGEPACASQFLLQQTLYGQWGFEGYVVSDCGAINDINANHHVTNNQAESSALAVKSGCQLNCGSAYAALLAAVSAGLIDEETITKAVTKLFEARFRLGMFDDDCPYDAIEYSVVECPEHLSLSRQMAQESLVLLKNDGILPLDDRLNVAVIGPNADDGSVLLGNYNGTPSRTTTLLRGIQEAAKGRVLYAKGCHIFKDVVGDWEEHPLHEAILAARHSDVVVLCLGLNPSMEGEEGDAYNGEMSGDKGTLALPKSQRSLFEALLSLQKPIVLVNVSGSCVDLSAFDAGCNAVVQLFYPGAEGGKALADVLFGRVSPSGRLPVTFYAGDEQLKDFSDYDMDGRTYRYLHEKPLYPFGHGLSYTSFAYENLRLEGDMVKLTLRNTGRMDANHAVLAFLRDPQEQGVNGRLSGFEKVFVPAGQEVELTIALCPEILALFARREGLQLSLEAPQP